MQSKGLAGCRAHDGDSSGHDGTSGPRAGAAECARRSAGGADDDPVRALVGRLDLEKYKATIKGLTQFGDRRQGTDRNRAAIDWIEAQLKSYGCTNTERIKYEYQPPAGRGDAAGTGRRTGRRRRTRGGGRRGEGRGEARRGGGRWTARRRSRTRGVGRQHDLRQPRPHRREQRSRRAARSSSSARSTRSRRTPGPREEVYCTKIGTTRPDEMYIIGAHMDGHGWGEAANDDGSGTALVMELARIFSSPDVQTERSIRFVLWNNEETGLNGAAGVRRAAAGAAGQGRSAGIGQVSGAEMARHDSARHDDVRPRHAGPRRQGQPRAAARGRREHRVPVDVEVRRRRRRSSRGSSRRRTRSTRPTIRRPSART